MGVSEVVLQIFVADVFISPIGGILFAVFLRKNRIRERKKNIYNFFSNNEVWENLRFVTEAVIVSHL